MQQEEITAFIVAELAKHHPPKDITISLCEKARISWADADKLVRQVQASHGREIAARQSPLLIFFSMALLIVGLGAIAYGVISFTEGVVSRSTLQYFLLGLGLVLGGIIGLWSTIAALFKS